MLLSGAYACQKGMEKQFCCPVESLVVNLKRSESLVGLVPPESERAHSSQVHLSLPSSPLRLSARNKMPVMVLSVSTALCRSMRVQLTGQLDASRQFDAKTQANIVALAIQLRKAEKNTQLVGSGIDA